MTIVIPASIPSPGSKSLSLGPLELRAYGVMIALGVIAAVWLASKRLAERGGNPEAIGTIPCGAFLPA